LIYRSILLSLLFALFSMMFSDISFATKQAQTFRILTEEFPPYNYTSDSGSTVGISTEIVREILKRIGHPDNIEVMPWVDGYRLAQEQDNVVLFSTTRSPMRENLFKWVGPLVPNNLALFARIGSTHAITSLEDAKGVKAIGVYQDDFGGMLLKEKGFTNLDAVIENSLNISRLLSGEIDLWIANELTAKHMIAEAGVDNRIEMVYTIENDYMSIAFSRRTPDEVINEWQQKLDDIKSDGTYAQIFSRWLRFSYTDDLKPHASKTLSLSDKEKIWLRQHPVIRIAPDPDFAPFQFRDEGGAYLGLANDYLTVVGRMLGIRFEFLNTASWQNSLMLMEQGEADLVVVATETQKRRKYMRFTSPYVEQPDVIITRSNYPAVSSLEQFKGKKVISVEGFAVNGFIRKRYPQIELVLAPDVKSALQMVSTGEADASVLNIATTSYTIEKWKISNLRINGEIGFSNNLAFASRKDWPVLHHLLEKALNAIAESEKQRILTNWITISRATESARSAIEFTEEENRWLNEHPVVLAAADPKWPPMEYMDENGEFSGMVADYMSLIEDRLGIHIKLVPQANWSDALKSIQEREVSILTAAARTPDRDQYLQFTDPFLELPVVIIVNNTSKDVSSMADLRGKRVAVVKDYGTHEFLKRGFPYLDVMTVVDIESGLYDISYGKLDAIIANIASASFYIEKNAIQNLRIAGESGYVYELGIASRNDWPMLHRLLQKGVASITPEERQTIYRKWIGLKSEVWRPSNEQLVSFALGMIIIGFITTLVWNSQLRRKVEARTQELQASELKFKNLYKTAFVGLYRTSVDGGKVLTANPALASQFGYDSVDDLIENFSFENNYIEPGQQKKFRKMLRQFGKVDNFEFLGRLRDGSIRKFLLTGTLYESQGYIEGAVLDITDRKNAEEEAKYAREMAEQANRAKSDFLAVMSHEMRTPLNAVLGLSHLTLQQKISSQQRGYLSSIQTAARSLLDLINDILDLSKVEAGHLELEYIEFDVDQVLEKTAIVAGHQAISKGLDFSIYVASDVPHRLIGDPQRLGQILLNLAGNAVKFTESGKIVISVKLKEHDDSRVCLLYQVQDTGIGMSDEQTQIIFDAFTQGDSSTTRRYGGSGLGLNIASLLIDMMDGEVEVQSEVGQGSTFTFNLWMDKAYKDPHEEYEYYPLTGCRLLVSDSLPLVALLERAGSHVTVIDSQKILQTSQAVIKKSYDLIVYDAREEELDEWRSLRLHLRKDIKMLVLSGAGLNGNEESRITYLHEPLTPIGLCQSVARLLGRDAPSSIEDLPMEKNLKEITGQRVLLVEDNYLNQQVGKGLLMSWGVEVKVADSGQSALTMLEEEHFDLVLMDIQMPDMSGYEVTKNIRRDPRIAEIPVVAMTAHAMKRARKAAYAAGMNDFLTKPIDPDQLYRIISQYLVLSMPEANNKKEGERFIEKFDDIPGIDTAEGLQRSDYNVALYLKLLRDFERHHSEDGRLLQSLLMQGKNMEGMQLAHTLKGVAGNLGAKQLQDICRKIENNLPYSGELSDVEELQRILKRLIKAIKQIPDNMVQLNDSAVAGEITWAEIFANLVSLLKQGNIRAVDLISAVHDHAQDQYPELADDFEEQVTKYRFDAALTVLNKLDLKLVKESP
jgi:PAS domain S-box-containing protein